MLPELRVPHSSGELPLRSVRESQSESLVSRSAERRGGGSGGASSMKRLIYLSGPYTAPTYTATNRNIMAAREVAIKVFEMGAVAITPHLLTFHFEVDCKLAYDDYMAADYAIIERCDALLMIPRWQYSKGANLELQFAESHALPVFYSTEELHAWLATFSESQNK